jgi:glycosyltransferase involved in cell wall biosynthesis
MRILISSLIDLQKSSHNSRLHQFLKYLSKNHNITVLSLNDWWKSNWDNRSNEYQDDFHHVFDNIESLYLTDKKISPVLQDILSVLRPQKIESLLKNVKYDLHFSYNSLFCGYTISKYFNSKNINTIYDIADDLPAMASTSPQIPRLLKPLGGFVTSVVLEENIRLARKVTYTTNSLITSCKIPNNKSVLIPNGVDTELFREYPSSSLRNKLGIDNCFVIGHVGVLREWLDFRPLFNAFRFLSKYMDARLLIVGGGIGYDETTRLAEEYGISKSVLFTGTVPYSQVPYYISCMDVCAIPFKLDRVSQNSLPLKIFEYMSCNKPVISTNIQGVIENFQNNVLYVSNSEDYIHKIKTIYLDDELRKRLGSIGRSIVISNYDWRIITEDLENLFENSRVSS